MHVQPEFRFSFKIVVKTTALTTVGRVIRSNFVGGSGEDLIDSVCG